MSTSHATAESPKALLAAAMAELKLTVHAEFVPWSKSRGARAGAKVTERSLNWRVTLKRDGRDVLVTDYSAGIGHCPSYRGSDRSVVTSDRITFECENGYPALYPSSAVRPIRDLHRGPLLPDSCDVMHSLLSDSDAIESPNFETTPTAARRRRPTARAWRSASRCAPRWATPASTSCAPQRRTTRSK